MKNNSQYLRTQNYIFYKINKTNLIKLLKYLQNMALNNVYNGCKQG